MSKEHARACLGVSCLVNAAHSNFTTQRMNANTQMAFGFCFCFHILTMEGNIFGAKNGISSRNRIKIYCTRLVVAHFLMRLKIGLLTMKQWCASVRTHTHTRALALAETYSIAHLLFYLTVKLLLCLVIFSITLFVFFQNLQNFVKLQP